MVENGATVTNKKIKLEGKIITKETGPGFVLFERDSDICSYKGNTVSWGRVLRKFDNGAIIKVTFEQIGKEKGKQYCY